MAVYTRLDDTKIAALVETYGLGTLAGFQGIAEGVENSNFLVQVRDEAGEEAPVILTVYEKRVDTADLPFFLGIMEHLAARGIPCPQPLHTPDGRMLVTVRDKTAAMVTFLEGKSPKVIRNTHLRELGGMMARMHLAAEGFALSRPNTLSLHGWQALITRIGTKADAVTPGLAAILSEEYAVLSGRWPAELPRGVIHADLFPDNVFFLGERLSGVIDFYFACEDAFMYDLAIVMNAWCFEGRGEFNVTKAGTLLHAYHAVRPITPEELAALPTLCRGAALRFLLTRTHDWVFHDKDALVRPHDPREYLKKLQFHRQVTHHGEYGL